MARYSETSCSFNACNEIAINLRAAMPPGYRLQLYSICATVFRFLIFCTCWWMAISGASAQEMAKLFDDSQAITLATPLQWQSTLKGAVRNPDEFNQPDLGKHFALLTPGSILPTAPDRDVWLQFALPASEEAQTWFVRIPRLQVERVTLYFQHHDGKWFSQTAGENVPMNEWPVATRNPSFAIHTHDEHPSAYYLKLEHRVPITEHPQLISPSDYIDGANRVGNLTGLMFGVFGGLTVIGFGAARLNRNKHFAWFAAFVLMILFSQLISIGYANQRFWPGSVYLAQVMGWIVPLCTMSVGTWFCSTVSYSRKSYPVVFYTSVAGIIALLLAAIAFAVWHADFPRSLLNALVAVIMAWNLVSCVWIARRSQPWLWFVVAGLTPLALSTLVRLAYNVGWVNHVEIAQLASVITGSLGMMIIYAGMMLRNRENYAAMARETALDHTDAVTGLSSERMVQARLPHMLARSKRFNQPCGVLMLRWLEYSKFMETMTTAQQSAALAHLGTRLRRLVREFDTVARVGDNDFVFLIESPVDQAILAELGTQILSNCMRPAPALGRESYDVHMAIWATSTADITSKDILEVLRTRLSQMSVGTARRMQFIDSPLSTGPGDDQETEQVNRKELVAKINAIEADPIIPTLAPARAVKSRAELGLRAARR
jgi:two-component system, sensor histidine kinase LadS